MPDSVSPRISSGSFTQHLDALRVGAYFGLLYLLLRPVVDSADGVELDRSLRVAGVVVFLILDCIVRWLNRRQIFQAGGMSNSVDEEPRTLIWQILLLVFEIFGVAMFATWAVAYICSDDFGRPHLLALSMFLFATAVHNAIHIHVYPGMSFFRYLWVAVVGDALKIELLNNNSWIRRFNSYFDDLQRSIKETIEAAPKKVGFWRKTAIVLRLCCWHILLTALVRLLVQHSALHLFVFNAYLGVLVVLTSASRNPAEIAGTYVGGLPDWLWWGCPLVAFVALCTSSLLELSRKGILQGEPLPNDDKLPRAGRFEKVTQAVAGLSWLLVPAAFVRLAGVGNAWQVIFSLHLLIIVIVVVGSSLEMPQKKVTPQAIAVATVAEA